MRVKLLLKTLRAENNRRKTRLHSQNHAPGGYTQRELSNNDVENPSDYLTRILVSKISGSPDKLH